MMADYSVFCSDHTNVSGSCTTSPNVIDVAVTSITETQLDLFTILRTVTVLVRVADPAGGGAGGGGGGGGGGAVPVSQEIEQEARSGEVDLLFEVSNEGDFAFQWTPAVQFGNTGNLQSAQGFGQFGSEAEDFEAEGIEFAFEPELDAECEQMIQRSAAASG
jgi:hypothetical protein